MKRRGEDAGCSGWGHLVGRGALVAADVGLRLRPLAGAARCGVPLKLWP